MTQFSRKLYLAAILALPCIATVANAQQTFSINGATCLSGSVTFSPSAINVTATGSCISTQVVTPTLTSLSLGSATPGTPITATGTNFAAGATVTVGSTLVSTTFISATSLTFVVPAVSPFAYNVYVTLNGQSSNTQSLTVTAVTPTVTGVNQASAAPGATIIVSGTNFAAGATATVNGINAPVIAGSVTSTSLSILLPAMPAGGPHPVVVTVGGTPSLPLLNAISVTTAMPAVTGFSPSSATVGSNITLTGTGFAPGATVTIGGQPATVVGTPTGTSIVATVPSLTVGMSYPVVAIVALQPSTAATSLLITSGTPAPTVTACSGTVSGALSITGTNFVAGSTMVTLNAITVSNPTVATLSITGTVPAGVSAGTPAVFVSVSGQSSASFNCTISAAGGGGTITVDKFNNVIPTPSKLAGVTTPFHQGAGANGFGNTQQAWDVDVTGRCTSAVPAIGKLWYHNMDFQSYIGKNQAEYFGIYANEALVYGFTAPAASTRLDIQSNSGTYAQPAPSFMSISTTPCDFDPAALNAPASSPLYGCFQSGGSIGLYSSSGPASGFNECKIVPGQRYYLNYRSWQPSPIADACLTSTGNTGTPCGGLLTFR